jgi:hypothetical protein
MIRRRFLAMLAALPLVPRPGRRRPRTFAEIREGCRNLPGVVDFGRDSAARRTSTGWINGHPIEWEVVAIRLNPGHAGDHS